MQIIAIELFELLKPKLGDKEARTLVTYVEAKTEEAINQKKDVFLTKEDKVDMIERIEKSKSDIIKWMSVFWIGQMAVTVAIVKLLH